LLGLDLEIHDIYIALETDKVVMMIIIFL